MESRVDVSGQSNWFFKTIKVGNYEIALSDYLFNDVYLSTGGDRGSDYVDSVKRRENYALINVRDVMGTLNEVDANGFLTNASMFQFGYTLNAARIGSKKVKVFLTKNNDIERIKDIAREETIFACYKV